MRTHTADSRRKSIYVMLGLLALILAYPLATAMDGFVIESPFASLSTLGQDENNANRRTAAELRRVCMQRVSKDHTVVCPDINDVNGVYRFLKNRPAIGTGSVHAAAPLRIVDLTELQQSLLKRFTRVRACPDTLDALIPGFQELCEREISRNAGILLPAFKLPTVVPEDTGPTLDQIIEQRSGTRPDR